MMSGKACRLLATMLGWLATFGAAVTAPAVFAEEPAVEVSVPAGRARVNFNAGWRFALGSHPGAQVASFDDSKWEQVGLPHSFSMPYFRAPDFYTGDGWYRKAFILPALPRGLTAGASCTGKNGGALASH